MKLLPMRFRETQSQWFAKRGISWHFSAVFHKSNHPDGPVVYASEHTIRTYVVAIDSCKLDWFSVSCKLEEVLVRVKKWHQSVFRAILRSDNAGCYHCSALLSTINSTSRRSGIEVIRYDFCDPQSAKDLCDRKIAPWKQRLRYVAEKNVESAKDIKKGLGSLPGIAGMSVAECKIDQSVMSVGAANNKISGITKYSNSSMTSKSMRVWHAYNVGEGLDIKRSWNEQRCLRAQKNWGLDEIHKRNARQRENAMSLSVSILLAALNLLVLPPSRQLRSGQGHNNLN